MLRSLGKDIGMFVPFFLLVAIFVWRLFYPHVGLFMIPDFGLSDVLHQNLPLKDFLSQSLKAGKWPLWNSNIGTGFPVLAESQIGALYWPNLILFWLLPTIWAYNLSIVVSLCLAGIGTYCYCRLLGMKRVAGLYGAIVFAFCGFFSVHLNHINILHTAALMPLLFTGCEWLLRRPKNSSALFFALLFSQQLFSGSFPIAFITLFSACVYWLLRVRLYPPGQRGKRASTISLGVLLGLGLSAIQLGPTIELWQVSARQSGLSFSTVTAFPYPWKHFMTFIWPYYFGNPGQGTYPPFSPTWGIFWENTAYLGGAVLFLAATTIVRSIATRRYLSLIWITLLGLSLLLVVGKYSPLYFVFAFFPFTLFRVPSRFLLLTAFSCTVLAASQVQWLLSLSQHSHRHDWKRAAVIVSVLLVFCYTVADEYQFSYTYPPVSPATWWTQPPETVSAIKLSADPTGRLAVFSAEETWNSVFLTTGWKDLRPYRDFRLALSANYSSMFTIPQVDVYSGGLLPKRTLVFKQISTSVDQAVPAQEKEITLSTAAATLLSLAHTTTVASTYHIHAPGLVALKTIPPKFSSYPLYLYHNTRSLPRPFLVYSSIPAENIDDIINALTKVSPQPRAIVENPEAIFSSSPEATGTAQIISETDGTVTISAQTSTQAMLVLSDTYYPGWITTLDGELTRIFPVNINARGIMIPKGTHTIGMIYQPKSFLWGKYITYSTMLLSVFLCFFSEISLTRNRPYQS